MNPTGREAARDGMKARWRRRKRWSKLNHEK
jgi:hypothetical protein